MIRDFPEQKTSSLLVSRSLKRTETDGLEVGIQVGIVWLVASGHLQSVSCKNILNIKDKPLVFFFLGKLHEVRQTTG